MGVESRTPATSKMELLVTNIKKWKLLNVVSKSSILDLTVDTKNEEVFKCHIKTFGSFHE